MKLGPNIGPKTSQIIHLKMMQTSRIGLKMGSVYTAKYLIEWCPECHSVTIAQKIALKMCRISTLIHQIAELSPFLS